MNVDFQRIDGPDQDVHPQVKLDALEEEGRHVDLCDGGNLRHGHVVGREAPFVLK